VETIASRNPAPSHIRLIARFCIETANGSFFAICSASARFDQDARRDAGAVVALFDAMIRALTGGERRH
jgi:hypothetical protein